MVKLRYTEKAPAKINLAIDVLRKRDDGFHDVKMIMQSIDLYDVLTVEPVKNGKISVTMNTDAISNEKSNIVYKTAELLKRKHSIKQGAKIHIEKNIPLSAGLAGGSADAAATIKLLNRIWGLKMNKAEMKELGKQIGSDVPFCIEGGTALAQGLGEKLTYLKTMPECFVLLAKPGVDISTKEVYEGINLDEIKERPDIEGMLENIKEGNLQGIASRLCNVLENVTIKKCSDIPIIKESLIEDGALGSVMSGRGPTVFGIFDDQDKAYYAYDNIKSKADDIFLVKALPHNNISE